MNKIKYFCLAFKALKKRKNENIFYINNKNMTKEYNTYRYNKII